MERGILEVPLQADTAFVIQDLASEVLIKCIQVDIGQETLGHVHPKNYKFFYESLLVLFGFR